MLRRILLIALTALLAAAPCMAAGYNYVAAGQLKQWLAGHKKLVIVDLQPADEFRERHYDDSLWVGPLAGKNSSAFKKLDRIGKRQLKSAAEIVIVSCTGAKDARQALDRLSGLGIDRKRLLILEQGMDAAMHGVGCECCLTKADSDQKVDNSTPAESAASR